MNETLCHVELKESEKSQATCLYCMALIMAPEKAWVTRNGRYFCCWECVQEYDAVQRSY